MRDDYAALPVPVCYLAWPRHLGKAVRCVNQTDAKNLVIPLPAVVRNEPMLVVTLAAEVGSSITHQIMNATAAHPAMVLRSAALLAEVTGETPDSAGPDGTR